MFTRLSDITASRKSSLESRRQESVVPMINVVFLLLLYFMVAGSLRVEEIVVNPPESSAMAEPPRNVPQLALMADGGLYYEGRSIAPGSLAGVLAVRGDPKVVRLAADAGTEAVLVSRVIEDLSKIGFDEVILLSVRRRGPSGVARE